MRFRLAFIFLATIVSCNTPNNDAVLIDFFSFMDSLQSTGDFKVHDSGDFFEHEEEILKSDGFEYSSRYIFSQSGESIREILHDQGVVSDKYLALASYYVYCRRDSQTWGQVNLIRNFLPPKYTANCEKELDSISNMLFKKLNVGDTVQIGLKHSYIEGDTVHTYWKMCPDALWEYDEDNDVSIKGVVICMYDSFTRYPLMNMLIVESSNKYVSILGHLQHAGDTAMISLAYDKVLNFNANKQIR